MTVNSYKVAHFLLMIIKGISKGGSYSRYKQAE